MAHGRAWTNTHTTQAGRQDSTADRIQKNTYPLLLTGLPRDNRRVYPPILPFHTIRPVFSLWNRSLVYNQYRLLWRGGMAWRNVMLISQFMGRLTRVNRARITHRNGQTTDRTHYRQEDRQTDGHGTRALLVLFNPIIFRRAFRTRLFPSLSSSNPVRAT
jgi:hypothetical protein